jgi:hypothetical protein
MAPIRTQWRTPPPWFARPRGSHEEGALLALALESMRRGHRRVAAQRLLMLQARGGRLPGDCLQYCDAVLATLSGAQQARMREAAAAWAAFVGAGAQGVQPPPRAR